MKYLIIVLITGFVTVFCLPWETRAESLETISQRLVKDGVIFSTDKNRYLFTLNKTRTPAQDRSFATVLADHYIGSQDYAGISILSQWQENGKGGGNSGWKRAADRAVTLSEVFHQKGIKDKSIQVIIQAASDLPVAESLSIAFHQKRGYFRRVGDNLLEGFTDIIASPTELPRTVMAEGRESGALVGGTKGVLNGFGSAVRRAGNGAIRILTFWAD